MALTTRRLALSILFLGLFAMAMKPSVDTDSFWHLRAGAWMLDNARLLTIDLFSYTRFNQAWINHSWLSQTLMAIIYRVGGYGGLNLFTASVIVLAFVFVYRAGEGGGYLRAFIIILAATTSGVYWSARPQILSLLLTAIFVYILYDYLWRDANRLWLLPPLMLLWVNLHGGFAIGFILLVIAFIGELLRTSLRVFEKQSQSVTEIASQRTLAMTNSKATWIGGYGLACAVVACLNPYGAQMLLYPFRTVSIGVLQNFIQEWQSPNFHQPEAQVFIVMLLATVAAIGFSRRRLDLTDFLVFAVFSALSLLAWRNVAAFAVVVAPILMRYANSAVEELQEKYPKLKLPNPSGLTHSVSLRGAPRDPKGLTLINGFIVIVIAFAVLLKMADAMSAKTNDEAIAKLAPVKAAEYLKANPVAGKMFNAYNFGGYLIWALYPHQLVYVDGRTDLYDGELLKEYLNTALADEGWNKTLKDRDIGVVLVETVSPLARALAASPAWSVKYQDKLASVIVKNQ
ncbi:MAG: hypothetical protein HZB77_02255 [Chloroflexi bacterium]|nr:hypothetical protein [Chloroflexota bacterium]